ncbi:MATE family efflux transporter [Beijerinckiaceae bacterium]|nr:MATE family efflux transporter [Beijerinckiaceae bacterium]
MNAPLSTLEDPVPAPVTPDFEESLLKPSDLADPRLFSLIMRLALPSVCGLSIHALHHVVNAAFIGNVGPEAVAAVSVVFPIFLFISAIGHGLGVGCAASIGRHLGAGNTDEANSTATIGLGLAGLVGVACTVGLLIWLTPLLRLFGATPAILPPAQDYVGVLAFGCAFTLLQILCDFIVISEGNTRFSMWTLIGGFTLNIILDPIFIFGCNLGVSGAALATMTSQLAALAAFALYFKKSAGNLRVHWRLFRPTVAILRPIFSVGLPATLTTALSAITFTLIYRTAGAYGGEAAIAAIGIALRVFTLGELPLVGFCIGAQAVLSYAWGAKAPLRVLSATRFMLLVTTAFAVAHSVVILTFSHAIVGLFTKDPSVLALGTQAVIAFHLFFGLTGLQLVVLVLLQSLDKGRSAAIVSLAPQGYLLIPPLLILPRLWGLDGVIMAPAVAIALTVVIAGLFLWRETEALKRFALRGALSSDTPARSCSGPL